MLLAMVTTKVAIRSAREKSGPLLYPALRLRWNPANVVKYF